MKRLARKWDFKLDLISVFADEKEDYTEDEIIEKGIEIKEQIDKLIEKIKDLTEQDLKSINIIEDDEDKENLIYQLEQIRDNFELVTEIEDFDSTLEELYDVADMYGIWVDN